ncbi:MAG: threonine ammonia-lyase, biosynthetic [Proteobacteria bacterium]|nr:threonine ammonia-lyase, biosynthetic [Pseudomonadota bacterium]NOG60479.1 threonine ammonia-lyase, biosynthetic [Pseudomonadota bacterium]
MFEEYKKLIDEAGKRIYTVAKRTDLDHAPQLSQRLSNNIWLKREDQQPVFSYKLRGAYNMIASLSEEERKSGVITASAGNHAQGVALAAQGLALKAVIVMPKTTPDIKVSSVKRMNAEVVLHGNTYDEAKDHAYKLSKETGMYYIPPFDHPLVIAGQATVGVELLEQHPGKPDVIFVPVGGGGLIAGIAAYVKEHHPEIKIIGVEHDEAPSMHHAFEANDRVVLDQIGIFADGAAVIQVGEENYRIAKELVDEVLLVTIDDICAAVKDIFEDTRSIPEPAGALALAGLKQYVARENINDKELIAIFSGANVNFDRLRHIAELSALGEHREALLVIGIPERPGSFRHLCHDLGPRLITEFNYRYADNEDACVFVGVQLKKGISEKDALMSHLLEKGYDVTDLSNDTVAKMHIRYMVGGHAPQAENEVIYRFEFPERSGALLHFLNEMNERWNISLFHYRNHGAAYGRVLMGFQVKEEERDEFQKFVDGLGITYWKETNNPAYQKFLS